MSQVMDAVLKDQEKTKHLQLAGIVKSVHSRLREKYKTTHDCDKVWREHCEDHSLLQQYANAMHHLATEIWTKHPETRIDWCYKVCREYFIEGGLQKVLDKERRRKIFAKKQQAANAEHSSSLRIRQRQRSKSEERSKFKGDSGNRFDVPDIAILSASANQIQPYLKNISSDVDCLCPSCDFKENELPPTSNSSSTRDRSSPSEIETCNPNIQPASLICDYSESSPVTSTSQGYSIQSGSGSESVANSDTELIFGLPDEFASNLQDAHGRPHGKMFNVITLPFEGKMRLLDVGSCYNPFQHFDDFHAVGIDLVPAVDSVYQCDFLHLDVLEPLQLAADSFGAFLHNLKSPIESLPAETFHIVVFSLLLEYFPSTYQRWLCCQKANQLLAVNGILIIITPDSKHQNHNAPQMKSWKTAIEAIGFKRWRYVKLEHLHCMVFRKVVKQEMPSLIGEVGPSMLFIPQDNDNSEEKQDIFLFDSMAPADDELALMSNFEELPDIDLEDGL